MTDDDDAYELWRHKPENLDADGYPRPALTPKPFAAFDIVEHMRQTILSIDKAARLGVAKDEK